jgi:PAS domain S-box-containing protein
MKNKKKEVKRAIKRAPSKTKEAASSNLLFDIFQKLNLLIVALDKNKKIIFVNDAFCKITEYERFELIEKSWVKQFIPVEFAKAESAHLSELKKEADLALSYESCVKTKSGSIKWVFWDDKIIYDDYSKSAKILRVGIDITEFKLSEKKAYGLLEIIKKGKEEWETTADSLPELIASIDLVGNIIRINKIIEMWNLCPVKQAKDKHIHYVLHKECDDNCYFSSLLQRAAAAANEGKWLEYQTFDEKLSKYLFIRIGPLFKQTANKAVESLVLIISDVSEKVKAEKALQKRQKAFQLVYEIAATFYPNLEDICNSVAHGVVNLLEINHFDVGIIEGENLFIISRITGNKSYMKEQVYIDGTPYEYVIEKKEKCQLKGDLRQFFPKFPPLSEFAFRTYVGLPIKMSNGKIIGTISIMDFRERFFDENELQLLEIFASYLAREIERKEMEKKLQETHQMQLFGQLAAGVAHEVRNPLNTIIALAEAITIDASKNPEYRPYINQMLTQVNKLSKLMTDLLNFGKTYQKLEPSIVSIPNLCKEVVENWRKNHPDDLHQIDIIVKSLAKNLEIQGDYYKLQQAIYNLIENAAQNSPSSTEIIIEIHKPSDDLVKIKIIDKGIGIKPENLSKIFQPFFTLRKGGIGLGLTLVKQIVELHNGKIFINNNTPPPGITAEIILPVKL